MSEIRIPSEGNLHPLTGDKGEPSPIRFEYVYDTRDPLALTLRFDVGEIVQWTIARELLAEALVRNEPWGELDVVLWLDGDDLKMRLSNADGEARISASPAPARAWLEQSLELLGRTAEQQWLETAAAAAIAACLRLEAS